MPTKDEMGNKMEKIHWFCLKRYFGVQNAAAFFVAICSICDVILATNGDQ